MPEICQEKHRQIDKQFDTNERRLNNHSERIDNLEQFKSGTEVEVRNLVEQIKGLISIIKWQMATLVVMLGGFLIWYIQKMG